MASVTIDCRCGNSFILEIVNGQATTSTECPKCGMDGTAAACKIIASKSPAFVAASAPLSLLESNPQPPPSPRSQPISKPALTGPPPLPSRSSPARPAFSPQPPPPARWSPISAPTAEPGPGLEPGPEPEMEPEPEHWSLSSEARERAEVEARAKIMWGDPQEEVVQYLMSLCYSEPQAAEVVQGLIKERLAAIRANGMKKMIRGGGLICASGAGLLALVLVDYHYHVRIRSLWVIGSIIGIGVVGCWYFFDGSIKLISPQLERGDVAAPD